MFYLQYTGDAGAASAQINAMTSSTGTSAEATLLSITKTLALTAVSANYLQGNNYTGNIQLLIRGGWENGATTMSIKINNITQTGASTPRIRTGDPGMVLSPQ